MCFSVAYAYTSACAYAAAEGRRTQRRGVRALELMAEAQLPPSEEVSGDNNRNK